MDGVAQHGYPVIGEYLQYRRALLTEHRDEIQERIRPFAAELGIYPFRLTSVADVARLVHFTLHGSRTGYARGGTPAIATSALIWHGSKHHVAREILAFRTADQALRTHDVIQQRTGPDGRYRVAFDPLGANTGQFVADPTLVELARADCFLMRRAFVPTTGHTLVRAKYPQLGDRVLAALTGDLALTKEIATGGDIPGLLARQLFRPAGSASPSPAEVDVDRRRAQVIHSALTAGRDAKSLAAELAVAVPDVENLIAGHGRLFFGVRDFLADLRIRVCRDGYVDDCFRNRLDLPDAQLAGPVRPLRMTAAERRLVSWRAAVDREFVSRREAAIQAAVEFVIRGPVAAIMLHGMAAAHDWLTVGGRRSVSLVLPIGDELHFFVPHDLVEQFANHVPHLLTADGAGRWGLPVPVAVTVSVGPSWGELAPWIGGNDRE